MVSVYKLMEEDWNIYCLMSGIAFIEEMSKPHRHKVIRGKKEFWCYGPMLFRVINKDIINKWLKLTRIWERKLDEKFITSYFDKPKLDKEGKKWCINFLPNWLYHITKTVKYFPSEHVNKKTFDRLINWKISGNQKNRNILKKNQINSLLNSKKSLYDKLFKNKKLAAGAFVVSFDLEFRGLTLGRPDLCMSVIYKDFLEFILKVADKWGWATTNQLFKVNVDYSRNKGINAKDQYMFRIKSKKIEEIYDLAGPLIDDHKNKCIDFHVKRSKNFVNVGGSKETKFIILNKLNELGSAKSTELQFCAGVGIDVVLQHLNNFYDKGLINKERRGKYYLWSVKNAR